MAPPKKRLSSANETSSTPQKSNIDIAKQNDDGTTPRCTRRRSVVAEEINVTATPSTPTRRGRRLSEALAEDSNENGAGCATPTRRSRRLSGTLSEDCTTTAIGTPTRRSRRLSGTGLDSTTDSTLVTGDPLKHIRRTSGAGLDTLVDSPMPLGDTLRRTRRTSGTFTDINTDSPHAASLKRAAPSDIDSKLATSSKTPAKRGRRKSVTLEEVTEENEETVSKTLDVIKEDEEDKNCMDEKREKDRNYEEKENDNPIIDCEINKKEENEPANVIDNDKEAAVEETINSSKDEILSEESSVKNDELCNESSEIIKNKKISQTIIDNNIASEISPILGTDIKIKYSEDIENKPVESERMEVSETKSEGKVELNFEEENGSANVIDNDKEAPIIEEKINSSIDETSEESSMKKDELYNESTEAEKIPQNLIEDNIANKIGSILGTDIKIKSSEDIENKSVDPERMEVSETKSEDKSDMSIPSVTKSEYKLQKNSNPLNNNTQVLNSKNEKNNNTLVKKVIPRGMPKSGRFWKTEKKRFSTINAVKPLKTSWAKKMALKNQRKSVLEESNAIKEEKRLKKEALKERQKVNKELRDKNAKKSEIVQVIKDPRKIKKMKRNQLRYIETRDTSQPAKII